MILTGPAFQAKIPAFEAQSVNKNTSKSPLNDWLKAKREELLNRKYEEESDEE